MDERHGIAELYSTDRNLLGHAGKAGPIYLNWAILFQTLHICIFTQIVTNCVIKFGMYIVKINSVKVSCIVPSFRGEIYDEGVAKMRG